MTTIEPIKDLRPMASLSKYWDPILLSYKIEPNDPRLQGCVCSSCPLSLWQTISGKLRAMCPRTGLETYPEGIVQACTLRENHLSELRRMLVAQG